MTVDLQDQAYVNEAVLYMALELSNAKWWLAFGEGTRQRHVVIAAGDVASFATGSAASWWPREFGFRSVRTFWRAWRR